MPRTGRRRTVRPSRRVAELLGLTSAIKLLCRAFILLGRPFDFHARFQEIQIRFT
jgi:hypothetical protein